MIHEVTWDDVRSGRAELHIPAAAMIALAEKAGAPWNDHDPDAKLSDLQKEIITADERTIVVFGGSRGGKSIAGACIALSHLMIPNCQIALIGQNYEHCSKEFGYIWRGFFKLFPPTAATEAKFSVTKPNFSMALTTIWGSRIQVFSTTSKEGAQILGNEFDIAILCEAAQIDADIYHVKIERALLGRAKQRSGTEYVRQTGRAVLLTTPKQQWGVSYDLYNRAMAQTRGKIEKLRYGGGNNGVEWLDSMYFKQASVIELNPSYPKASFERARRGPKHAFQEQFLGMAVARSGLCYSSFREDVHVLPADKLPGAEILRRSTFGVGIDTGDNFAVVLAALTPEGKAYLLGEVFDVGSNTTQRGQEIMAMLDKVLSPLGVPDPKAAIGLWVVDVNSQNIPDLEDVLGVEFMYQKYDVLESIGQLDNRMANGEIFISDELEFFLHEMRSYRFVKPRQIRAGMKDKPHGDDHLLDAMRYLLMQLFEFGPPKEEEVAWSVDQMLEKERKEMLTCNMQRDIQRATQRWNGNILTGSW